MSLLKNIADKITTVNEIAGIEYINNDNGTHSISLCILKKKGHIIEKTTVIKDTSSVNFLTEKMHVNIPVAMVINGKGIIHKRVSHNSREDKEVLFTKTFPNIKRDDFYVQKIAIDDTHSYLSIARKDMVDAITEEIKKMKVHIIDMTFGPFTLNYIIPLLSDGIKINHSVTIGRYAVTLKDNIIDSFKLNETSISPADTEIGNEIVEGNIIISYTAAIKYFIDKQTKVSAGIKAIEDVAFEFRQRRIFLLAGKTILTAALLVLSINYMLFNYYYTRKNELDARVGESMNAIKQYDTLKRQFDEKRDFLDKSGMLGEAKTSYYSDKLAGSVPENILLDDMSINPVMKKPESDTSGNVMFTRSTITITGTSKNSVEVGEWIKVIKANDWVRNVELLSYNQDKERNEGKFNIRVSIK